MRRSPRRARRSTSRRDGPVGDRHHEPARDGRALGSRDGRAGRAARSCGRTAARPRAARSSRRAPSWITARTGLRARSVLLGDEARVAPCARRDAATRGCTATCSRRARSTAGCLASHRRRGARDRPDERVAHDAVRHRRARSGATSCCALFGVPREMLPEVRASSGDFGVPRRAVCSAPTLRFSASRATSRPRCSARDAGRAGTGKNTYGTGAFLLLNTGDERPARRRRACSRRSRATRTAAPAYALEGAIFIAGAAVQWLRDGLGIIASARRDGGARAVDRVERRRVLRSGAHRTRRAALGAGRARHDRRAHARHDAGAPRARRARGDGVSARRTCSRRCSERERRAVRCGCAWMAARRTNAG